jgi:4-hydroxy-tetrahydrodipicolinate synthase
MTDERKELIKGVVVASVTAATPDFDVDYDRLREQYRFIVEGGLGYDVGVMMAVGGGGEGYFLNDKQWAESVKIFAEEAEGKVATMVGVFELNTQHAIDKCKYAEELGIDFVQLAPPHYEKPTDLEVFTHYKMVNDAISKIGIIIYHTYWSLPEYYEMTAPLIARMADLEHVVGIKWASTHLGNFIDVLTGFRDRFAFIDNQGWIEKVGEPHGMTSFMFFPGNFDPALAIRVSKHFLAGEYDKYKAERSKGLGPREAVRKAILEEVHGPGSPETKTIGEGTLGKATMDVFRRPMGPAFPPQYNLSEEAKARVRKELGLS